VNTMQERQHLVNQRQKIAKLARDVGAKVTFRGGTI